MYEISWFKIKSAESAIPKAWVLEKSIDGVSYDPWQYFAVDDADCLTRYNLSSNRSFTYFDRHLFNSNFQSLTGRSPNDIFKSEKEVICSTEFSGSKRLKYGEAKFVVLDQRPNEMLTPDLVNFTLAQFIRIRLEGMQIVCLFNFYN